MCYGCYCGSIDPDDLCDHCFETCDCFDSEEDDLDATDDLDDEEFARDPDRYIDDFDADLDLDEDT